ncbi:MAG: SUMF1/EgtB/PvdO family nonheme iron enzyme [Planctomycetia bacterium]|nr:SUMF1/EgtB/PvdO family nonheme iron enzyme [Planctomycetia bacterium]
MLEHRCLLSITPSTVVGRFLFYDNSPAYDTTGSVQSPLPYSDDNAIATDKSAYIANGSAATFANVSSYSKGINGIMVDLQGGGAHTSIALANILNDFTFKVGNNSSPSTWANAPNPIAVTVRTNMDPTNNGADTVSGADRVELIWANGAITQQWLEVTVLATADTGLSADDVFFYGNEIGDTGASNTATVAKVTSLDITGAQTHGASLKANIPITNVYDFNKDGQVNSSDLTIAQTHGTSNKNGLQLFTPPARPPALGAALTNDTGTNGDAITTDPTINGTVTDVATIISFRASLNAVNSPSTAAAAQAVNMSWTTIGDPGNHADTQTVALSDGTTGYGSVDYIYKIGTYDVTNSQYVEFLNAKDPTGANTLGLYSSDMSSDPSYSGLNAGISFTSGNADGSKYNVISGHGKQPVNYVNWYDAIRFANWLNNGQGNGDTESGSYTLTGGTAYPSNGLNITRNPGGNVFLPSENEWYKAAYYNPATSSYMQFPTPANMQPTAEAPPGGSNSANYTPGGWPNPDYADAVGHLTDVGAYTQTASPYGTFDQGGNAIQWNESLIYLASGPARGLRGGSFNYVWDHMANFYRDSENPTGEQTNIGFRLVSIPSTDVLGLVQSNGIFTLSASILDTVYGGSLADGSYVLHLQAVDSNGLSSGVDVPFTLKRSIATPSQPVLISNNTNNVTNDNTPTIGVTAETGSLVNLFVDNVQVAQATATAGLQFTLDTMADGTYQITATSTDGAGNSATSPTLSITINTAQPAASGATLAAVTSSLASPVALSQPSPILQPSTTGTKATDASILSEQQGNDKDSVVDDWSWIDPDRRFDRDSNSSNIEATDFVFSSLTGDRLF